MHRFGRSAQQKMKDRWGGSFILATMLALGAAWILGTWASNKLWGPSNPAGADTGKPNVTQNVNQNTTSVDPDEFNLYYVQLGSFRSEAMAKRAASEYGANGYTTMVAPRNKDGFYQVYAGLFTDKESADEIADRLKKDGVNVWTRTEMVHYNPEAIPAAAMGNSGADVANGLNLLNVYLHESARWMEGRAMNLPADTNTLTSLGKQLGDLAAKMGSQTDPQMAQLVTMATKASSHATMMKDAATATTSSDAYQMAMTDYLSLLNQYQAFYSSK